MIPKRSAVLLGLVALFAASITLSSAADWTMSRCDRGLTGYTEEKLELPLSLAWECNTARFKGNPSTPAVANGLVYLCSGRNLYAVDVESGNVKWQYPTQEGLAGVVRTSVAVSDGLVFFGSTDNHLYAVNAETGAYQWAFITGGSIKSSPVVGDGIVYVGSDDDCLYAVNIETGESVWKSGFKTKDDCSASPAIDQGFVVFASKDTNLYAANLATGAFRWNYPLASSLSGNSPVISNGSVYYAAGNTIHVLTLGSGQIRNTVRLKTDAVTSPAVTGKDIYVACRDKKLYAYEITGKTIKMKWSEGVELKTACTAPPTVAGDLVLVPCAQGIISAFSTVDGSLKWRYVVTPSKVGAATDFTSINSSLVVANGALYILSDDGALRCFKSTAADDSGPEIVNVDPPAGTVMSGSPPVDLKATIVDMGSGIDENSIQLTLDKEPVDYQYDISKSSVAYQTQVTQPLRPLSDGPHTIGLTVRDWKGNKLETNWSFVVDNTMRPKVLPKKPSGEKAKTDPNRRPSMNRPGTNEPSPFNGPAAPSGRPSYGQADGRQLPPPPPAPGGAGMPAPPPAAPGGNAPEAHH